MNEMEKKKSARKHVKPQHERATKRVRRGACATNFATTNNFLRSGAARQHGDGGDSSCLAEQDIRVQAVAHHARARLASITV